MTPAEMQRVLREGVPLAEAWQVAVLAVGEGTAELRLPATPDLLRPGGTISGPALMGLADMAMWVALLSLTGGRDESLTANLAITFLRPPGARAVTALARVIKRGRTLSYGEVILRGDGEEAACAHVTTSWAALRR
jgi:uncharacterized protein (TIGR00369 family)